MTQLTKGFFTDQSIASGAGTQELLCAADPNRQFLLIYNPNSAVATLHVQFAVGVAANGPGDFRLPDTNPGMIFDRAIPTQAVYVIQTAGSPVTCWTYP
jgi:hypothetical protein